MPIHISTVVLKGSWTSSFEGLLPQTVLGRRCFFSFLGEDSFRFWSALLWVFGYYYMMKLSGFWVLLFVLQTSLLLHCFPSCINASSSSDMALNHHHVKPNECLSDTPLNRKLKFQNDEHNSLRKKRVHPGDLNLDDYHPIDPVPSSKTSVKPGPIEHGAPLLPHIPNPPPPDQPGDYA